MSSQDASKASKLLALSCYTRGLWSPILIWRALSRKPYRGDVIQWGLDEIFVKKHLRRSFVVSIIMLTIYSALWILYIISGNSWPLFVLVLYCLLEWSVLPWMAARRFFCTPLESSSKISSLESPVIVCRDSSSALPDLGYLLREAIFSVDCSSLRAPEERIERLTSSLFYKRIADSVSSGRNLCCHLLSIKTSEDLQPRGNYWGSWYKPRPAKVDSGSPCVSRLVVLGEHPGLDGLASMEFMARDIEPHLSFVLRIRWLPPLSSRIHRLAHLAQQRIWWRCVVVPAFWGILLVTLVFALGHIPEILRDLDVDSVLVETALVKGPTFLMAILASIFSFSPLIVFLSILMFRGLRYVRGFLYGATGVFLHLESPNCIRFNAARLMLENSDELNWGISYCQILEEIVTNAIISVLREHGVDTSSIRQELSTFVNQGVYVTGGSLMAENLAVGAFARIKNKTKMRNLRHGRRMLKTPAAAGL